MYTSKSSYFQTFQFIVDLLSFDTLDSHIKSYLVGKSVNWDLMVMVASDHLVLTAVYCRLNQRGLLKYLPKELVAYLKELTSLNRERNNTLLNEASIISDVFKRNEIDHVFIKGIALLATHKYEDIGERMIGDIDILVSSEHLEKAFDLLVHEGYTKSIKFNYEVKNYRHLPRQISEHCIGAVELHEQLLKYKYNHLIDKDKFLETKYNAHGLSIPSTDMLIRNSIYAHQINDGAYFYNTLKLKNLYDIMVLGLVKNKNLLAELSLEKYSRGFLNLASVLSNQIDLKSKLISDLYSKQLYVFTLKFSNFGYIYKKSKSIYLSLNRRLQLLIHNKSYRKHVLKSKLNF